MKKINETLASVTGNILVTFISILIRSWSNGFSLLQTRPDRIMGPTQPIFLKRFIAQRVYTLCTRINYNIVPVTNWNKYLYYGTSGTE